MPELTINGHRWHYETDLSAGTEAPALVLVHGATANLHIWDPVLDALTPHFRVFRPDLLGHGLSDKPADPAPYAIPAWADGLERLFDHWGLDRAVLCGHSLGGMIAQEFVLTRPGRVAALGLLCTTPGIMFKTDDDFAREDALLAFARENGLRALWEAGLDLNPYADRLAELPGGLERLAEEYLLNTVESFINTRNAMRAKPRHTGRLEEIAVPTAVFIGEHDPNFLIAADILAAKIPNATKYVIPDCGHSPQIENPAGAATVLARGLRDLARHAVFGCPR